LRDLGSHPSCSDTACEYSDTGFPIIDRQPVLIDFATSIFEREMYCEGDGSALQRDVTLRSVGSRLHQFTLGKNPIAASNCAKFIQLLKERSERPIVLVIGGGTIGLGADELYSDSSIELVGTDVYASPNTALVADAHKLPFEDGVFDGVWVQAVLEHVLEPATIVDEIHRVLRRGGLVYAETPFMQQVHERAYDFSRFTQSGHRWLFKRFSEISAGPIGGAGVALIWSIRYFCRALGAGDKLSLLISLPFFWIRFLDTLGRGRAVADAASGVFFLGRKADQVIDPHSMPKYYDRQT
jgi:SAM-dependent methyltransferase